MSEEWKKSLRNYKKRSPIKGKLRKVRKVLHNKKENNPNKSIYERITTNNRFEILKDDDEGDIVSDDITPKVIVETALNARDVRPKKGKHVMFAVKVKYRIGRRLATARIKDDFARIDEIGIEPMERLRKELVKSDCIVNDKVRNDLIRKCMK